MTHFEPDQVSRDLTIETVWCEREHVSANLSDGREIQAPLR
jgi:hypothetical protein